VPWKVFIICSMTEDILLGSRKYPAPLTSRELRQETSCDNRQMCGLSTDSLVLSHIQCRSILRFCIIYPLYMLHPRSVIMAKIILRRRSVWNSVMMKNVEFECYVIYNQLDWNFQLALKRNHAKKIE